MHLQSPALPAPTARTRSRPASAWTGRTESWDVCTGLPDGIQGLFIGVDPSLTNTGVTYFYSGRYHATRLTPPAGQDRGVARLAWFYDAFARVWATRPVLVGIEGYSFGSRQSHAHSLGELGGALRLSLFRAGVRFIEIPPNSGKKFATGNGAADKGAVSKGLFKRWGIDLEQNDEVDSACMGLIAMATVHGASMRLTDAQRDALKKVPGCG